MTELEKWAAVAADVGTIEDFLEWAQARGLALRDSKGYYPSEPTRQLLTEFYEIDTAKLEVERRALVESLRSSATEGGEQ